MESRDIIQYYYKDSYPHDSVESIPRILNIPVPVCTANLRSRV